MNEIDLDAFATGDVLVLDEEADGETAQADLEALAAEEVRRQEDALRREVERDDKRSHLRGLVYASQREGEGHIVVLHATEAGKAVMCNCPAVRSLNRRPKGCWAMVDARIIFGLPPIE